jgi:ribosomal protein S18 acetylase RimI-like enzyme
VKFTATHSSKSNMNNIRHASSKDISIIHRLAKEVFFPTYEPLQPKEKVAYLFSMMYNEVALSEQMEKKKHNFILTEDETGYLGYASFEFNYKGSGKIKIHKIYVMPNAQGKGVGKEMINCIANIGRQHKVEILLLDVYRHNPAIQFYEKLGFKKVGEQVTEVGNGFVMDDFLMEMSL